MTGFIAALTEAWSELRIHKTRILLALIGVALSVAALTTVVGLGNMAREAMVQGQEQQSGRPATLSVELYPEGGQLEQASVQTALEAVAERYAVAHSSLKLSTNVPFQFPDGVVPTETLVVDAAYGIMRRVDMVQGAWFAEQDQDRLAPAVIVNQAFYQRLGNPDLRTAPTVQIFQDRPVTAAIVGVQRNDWPEAMPRAMILAAHYDRTIAAEALSMPPAMELWVPEDIAEPLTQAISADLRAQFPTASVNVFRSDYAAFGDPFAPTQLVVGGIAGLVLLLGAVGLLNISMVTVRYRVREIGIRRSFGATSGRIFFGVMLESVVATFVAGVAGVMLAIAVVKSPWVQEQVAAGLSELPPFPLEAALIGLGAATAVGALAGLVPALVAVRVKVIDAIRY
ncbi:putative ABC transporter permease [Arthrobacter crystallopoietes BAB-32]|uniref:Putative ABC transporter permease n=1 Tax=Arthrobacter crystallopoietes BAB-32 TaxID=1246476 RepID=N1UU21_9MICC|nr:ABC transporter permease [Arthrobacter crystallopoietes]EMY33916.1 putative ABC transporter permease [Arthrobacter crystallopoietes BAB-32]